MRTHFISSEKKKLSIAAIISSHTRMTTKMTQTVMMRTMLIGYEDP
jgi:hypothetical protein